MTTYEIDSLSDTDSVHDLIFPSTTDDNFLTDINSDTESRQASSIIFDLTADDFPQTSNQRKGKNKAYGNGIQGVSAPSSNDDVITIDDDIYPLFADSSEGLRALGLDVEKLYPQTDITNKNGSITASSSSSSSTIASSSSQQKRKGKDTVESDNNKRHKVEEPIEINDDDDDDNACLIDLTDDSYTPYEWIDLASSDDEVTYTGYHPVTSGSDIYNNQLRTAANITTMNNGNPSGSSRAMIGASLVNAGNLMNFYGSSNNAIRTQNINTTISDAVEAQVLAVEKGRTLEEAEEELRALLENITNDDPPPPEDRTGTPEQMSIILMEHQKIGLQWMLKMETSNNKGGILADDMGLGKTVQAISVICRNPCDNFTQVNLKTISASTTNVRGVLQLKATLVICPVSLIDQWRREIETKTEPSLKVLVYHGTSRTKNPYYFASYDVIVTSYTVTATDFIETRKGPLSKVIFHRVILDEAHTIKNKSTQAARGCCDIKATYRWCMTATPIQNKIEELYSLIKFLKIRPFCEWDEFRDAIVLPMKQGCHQKAIRAAHFLMKAISFRRSKKAIIDGHPVLDLPERNIHMTHIQFSEDERTHYEFVNARAQARFTKYMKTGTVMKNYSSVLVMLLRLRQSCLHPSLTIKEGYDPIERETDQAERTSLARRMKSDVVQRLLSDSATIKEIECPICMDIAQDAQIMALCGHILCKECFDNYWNALNGNMKRCPQCRGPIDRQKLVDIESFLRAHAPELIEEEEEENPPPEESDVVELAKMLSSAKIDKMMEILDNTARESNNEDKTIVFSQFTSMLTLLENPLQRKGIAYLRYDGSMDVRHRAQAVNKFYSDPNIKVLLVSTKCGSLGLNLTCANRVILLDVWWNPAVENQAIDRVHRIGQKKTVEVHRIFIANTVEDRILELQKKKQAVTDGVLGEGTQISSGRLDLNELIYLFRGGEMPQNQIH
ncbi:hypothetical protein G6F56_005821 [Rhizopus delemar]|nr:hypothetical protein G6F56_005821 [Rhizopus delemar]